MKKGLTILVLFVVVSNCWAETRYSRMQKLFVDANGVSIQSLYDRGDMLWWGKCVTQNEPEKLTESVWVITVEEDEVLGYSLFSRIFRIEGENLSNLEEAQGFHSKVSSSQFGGVGSSEIQNNVLTWTLYDDASLRNSAARYSGKIGTLEDGQKYFIINAANTNRYSAEQSFCYFTEEKLQSSQKPDGEVEKEKAEASRSDLK